MKVKPIECSRENFPSSEATAEGIKVLAADETRRSVETILGVEYARKSGTPLILNILRPRTEEGESAHFPLVMFIQGSAWRLQEMTQQLAQLVRYAASGLVIAMIQYRPSSVAPFPAQIRDARSAARYMLAHAGEYGADPDRFVVWGDSSGAHTATMLAVTEGDPSFSDEAPPGRGLGIRGVIDYYGPTFLATMNDEPSIQDHDAPDSPEGAVLGGVRVSEHLDLVRKASPLEYISQGKQLPPFLMLHGDKDRLVPFGQSVRLFERLRECGNEVEMYRLSGADHGGNAFWTAEEPYALTRAFISACCS